MFPAQNLDDSFNALYPERVLRPNTDEFEKLYVKRPKGESNLNKIIRYLKRAKQNSETLRWYITGHTGCGKSTELSILLNNEEIKNSYTTKYIDIKSEYDINDFTYDDLIFTIAKALIDEAEKIDLKVSKELNEAIENWFSEIIRESITTTASTTGKANLGVNLLFLKLNEEIKAGGEKKLTIRDKVDKNITTFIKLINNLANDLKEKSLKDIFFIFDGLDHADIEIVNKLLHTHHQTISQLKLNMLFVVPLPILSEDFRDSMKNLTIIPNIPIYRDKIDFSINQKGFEFFNELIDRHCKAELFDSEARELLFKLSAGDVRDMIRFASSAVEYALDNEKEIVSKEEVIKVWYELRTYYRDLFVKLSDEDYQLLKNVIEKPLLDESLNANPKFTSLLHIKAIIKFPNSEGWYGLHPAVKGMLENREPKDELSREN